MKYITNNFVIFIDDKSDIDILCKIVLAKYKNKHFNNSSINKKELIYMYDIYKHKLIIYFSYNLYKKNNIIEYSSLNYFNNFQKDKYIFYNIKDLILREKITTLYDRE